MAIVTETFIEPEKVIGIQEIIESEKGRFPDEESVLNAFDKMDDWVDVINSATGLMPPEVRHAVDHSKAYLTTMLMYETIKQAGRDLSKYTAAIS